MFFIKSGTKVLLATLLVWAGVGAAQAQDIRSRTSDLDSTSVPAAAPPRVSYGLSAGAFVSSFGSGSFLAPQVNYRLTPRFQAFGSLMMVQNWGGPSFRTHNSEGGASTLMGAPDRQYLLHVGGTYAMSERLLLSGSVWKDLSPNQSLLRSPGNPFQMGRLPQQGFHFQAHYQVSPNVTISGGIRSGNGNQQGMGGYPMGGFQSPWGY